MTPAAADAMAALARHHLKLFPADAARIVESAPVAESTALLATVPAAASAGVMDRLASNVAADVLLAGPPDAVSRLLAAMDPVRAAAAISWFEPDARDALLARLDATAARELRALAQYPADTAGRLMDPRVMALRPETTVREAAARLRTRRARPVPAVFLIDDEGRLTGRVLLQDLAVASPDDTLGALQEAVPSIPATATGGQVVELLTDRKLSNIPVVDFEGRLIGVIRHDTLVKTAQQDVAADIQAMVGASRSERALSRVSFAVRARLPWLEINLLSAFLAASVVGVFESTIAQFTALAVLMPVVAGQSGNTGAQAMAVTMRGLALREIRVRQWPRIIRKEAAVALVNGLAVALTTALGVLLWSGSPGLAVVIGSSVVLSMVTASLAGATIPIVLTSLGQDPAQSASIFLTTVTDIVGFASFLGIATLLSGIL